MGEHQSAASNLGHSAETASEPDARIRVVFADDHVIVREGLAALLGMSGQFEVVGQCGNGREVVALVKGLRPNVVVLDIHMPGLNGIDVCGRLFRQIPEVFVLILSVRGEESFVIRAFENGARGYLRKESAATEFTKALHAIAAGQRYLGPGIDPAVLTRLHRKPQDLYLTLTAREREVLQRIAESQTNPQIATALGLSVRTVDVHRSRLMRKLDIHNVTTLVKFAWSRGLGRNRLPIPPSDRDGGAAEDEVGRPDQA